RFPLLRLAQEIARTHHEHWDGSGYAGLRGGEIPLASRIVSVADAFDALTNDRPYRPATTMLLAVEEIRRESGRQFDPEVVDALVRVLESEAGFTPGAELQLGSTERRRARRAPRGRGSSRPGTSRPRRPGDRARPQAVPAAAPGSAPASPTPHPGVRSGV